MAASKHVRALRPFYDERERVNREAGEEFDVTATRLGELNACGLEQCFAPLVEEVARKREPEGDGE